jgi:hypothetical protein
MDILPMRMMLMVPRVQDDPGQESNDERKRMVRPKLEMTRRVRRRKNQSGER